MSAEISPAETLRLAALSRLEVLDTPPEERFDRITRLVARLLKMPIALISLIDADRQWHKSVYGWDVASIPIATSFCRATIRRTDSLVVPDTQKDPRFAGNPLVTGKPGIRFYAGFPLRSFDGEYIGALCVIDLVPRTWSEDDDQLLREFAAIVEDELSCVPKGLALRELTVSAQKLHDEHARFQAFVENSPCLLFIKDQAGKIVFVNHQPETLTAELSAALLGGCEPDQITATASNEVLEFEHRADGSEETLTEAEYLLGHDGSKQRWMVVKFPIRNITGQCLIGGIAMDMTDQRQAEEALAVQHQLLRTLIDHLPDITFTKDRQGRFAICNPSMLRLLGVSTEAEVVGKTVFDFHPHHLAQLFHQDDLRVMEAGETIFNREELVPDHAGNEHWHLTIKAPLRDALGNITGLVGISRNIDGIKDAEAVLRDADRRKDEFLAMLAHELRNPLAAVKNAAAVLEMSDAQDDRRWVSQVVQRQIGQFSHLINDLLDVSRINSGKIVLRKQRLDAATLLDHAVEAVRPLLVNRRHQLTTEYLRGDMLPLEVDPVRFEQIIVNLLTNAIRYTEAGGHLRLSAERDGTSVVIRVRDNGIGIAPESLSKIFELFVQGERSIARSEGGLGIGLTVVKKLVEMHGGTVNAQSEGLGHGCQFTICLPVAESARELQLPPAQGVSAVGRVLVVDDNLDTAHGLARLLRLRGFQVEEAYTGETGLEIARRYKPDYVLLDIGLPGIDGYQVATALRQESFGESATIIAISGYGQDEDRRRSLEAGCNHHLVKPVDYDELRMLMVR